LGWALGNPWGGLLFGGLLRVIYTNHTTFFINSLAHTLGTKTYNENQTARDSVVMAFLAYGEGYHNFHHAFATDYRNGVRWYHWDPTKWLIRVLAYFGVTYRLKSVPQSMILRARLTTDQLALERKGVPAETLTPFKQKVEEAQRRMRALREEYARVKAEMREQSHRRLAQMKAEMKAARREFKLAWAQWMAVRKGAPRVRVAS
jgi:stearoyl-CoA desaturase (delta-9 desaturase)